MLRGTGGGTRHDEQDGGSVRQNGERTQPAVGRAGRGFPRSPRVHAQTREWVL